VVLAPALGALALLSPDLVPAVFGEQWAPATTIASLLAVRGLFTALSHMDRSVLLNAGRAGGELRVVAVLTAVHCGLVAAVAVHGVDVLALVLLVEAVLLAPLRPWLVHRWLGVPLSAYQGVLRVTASAAVAGLTVLLVVWELDAEGPARYAWVVLLGGPLYAVLLLLLARPVVTETMAALRMVAGKRRGRSLAAV
jgi:teichuronic acid exporter